MPPAPDPVGDPTPDPAGRSAGKSSGAFRTIGELSRDTGLPQHILRYWETRFPQLRPLQRAGNRRYYRPEDVALVRRIDALLNREGYTVRGVQQLLERGGAAAMSTPVRDPSVAPSPDAPPAASPTPGAVPPLSGEVMATLGAIRALLAGALADDAG